MPSHFDLLISVDEARHSAEFQLQSADGSQLGYQPTDFKAISLGHRQGLFDLRNYLRHYVDEAQQQAALDEIGVCIAEEVLGEKIFKTLWASQSQRTLRIQLPAASEENLLAAALARVPWEIAKPKPDAETLGELNLLVRVVHDMQAPPSPPVKLAADEALRVLFVFAEARGSRPLGARQERRELLKLFTQEIYPGRRVVAHFLTHGVTRERLFDQIQQHGGYHLVHWSGHGNLNRLELAKPGGAKDSLSGAELLELFADAGGFLPRLVFLSACHSGDILRVKDWNDFLALAQGKEPGAKEAEVRDLDIQEQPGFTGTAHALLQGGVPSVVAMRYAVGDDYARELAVEFYRALLAHAQPKTAAAALTMARQALRDGKKYDAARYAVCDHATPVLYGAEQPGLSLAQGRSPALNPHHPRLNPIAELSIANHSHFVGRTWELAGLGSDFIGPGSGAEFKPVAVITGLGGMGKTALVAEALELWESRFDWVLLYQAKENPLGFDAMLRDIDLKLRGDSEFYRTHVQVYFADAIHRDADPGIDFTGQNRLERLTRNLVRALQDEAILLVLDNFETNLKPQAEPSAADEPVWACQNPAWDRCLKTLAEELAGSRSRLLITSRRPLAALAGLAYPVLLGPLPPQEAALYLKAHPALSRLAFGGDELKKALALRLLQASRFHPLLMDRLARLAADASQRAQLEQALDTLEQSKDFSQLPNLFTTTPGDAKELAYLNDALETSLDQLIRDASPDARRLLWWVAVANEPVRLGLLESVWAGESLERQQLRQIKQMLEVLPQLPPEQQEWLQALPPEVRAMLDALPEPPQRPELAPLLRHLVNLGLVTEQRDEPDDTHPGLSCHELVSERIRAWMGREVQDRGGWDENTIRLAYAEWLEAAFRALQHQDMSRALLAGSQALVYCVQAEAWDRLGGFASDIVTSARDPQLLGRLIPYLKSAAEAAPEGEPRWSCLCYLADALRRGGRPDASLMFYGQAAALARAAAETGGEAARPAWADLAWISGNWANALRNVGELETARQRQLESAEAEKQAGNPAIKVIASELEALRIDIMQGEAEAALPQIEARLGQVAAWWTQQRSGQPVAEAPDAEFLARAYIGALDIAKDADYAREDWASALNRIEAILEAKQVLRRPAEDIAGDRMNRANMLRRLGRFAEAQAELEVCLSVFENDPARKARTLGSLAGLFAGQGDLAQAINQQRRALALFERLSDPADRAKSHHNLSSYLDRRGIPADLAEAPRHQLADLIYCLAAGLGQDLQTSLGNYGVLFRRARDAGTGLAVPRLADLLADPAFDPLARWLTQRQVDPAELQAAIDQILEQVRQAALAS